MAHSARHTEPGRCHVLHAGTGAHFSLLLCTREDRHGRLSPQCQTSFQRQGYVEGAITHLTKQKHGNMSYLHDSVDDNAGRLVSKSHLKDASGEECRVFLERKCYVETAGRQGLLKTHYPSFRQWRTPSQCTLRAKYRLVRLARSLNPVHGSNRQNDVSL